MWGGGKPSARSNLAMVPKLFNWASNLYETQMGSGQIGPVNLGLRMLSSINGNINSNEGVSENNDFQNDKDENILGNAVGELDNLNAPPQPIRGRPLRGEEQMPRPKQYQNVSRSRDFRPRGRDGGEQRKQPNSSSYDKSYGDLGYGEDLKSNTGPSMSELFERPQKPDLLKEFGISTDHKKESNPEEDELLKEEEEDEDSEKPPQDKDAIFKKMKESGLIPNAVAMLDGLCKDGLMKEAMKLFGQIREKGTMPDVIMYTAVVDGYLQAHLYEDAVRIFRKMQSQSITPNAYSYSLLVNGLIKCRSLDDAVDFCVEMLEAGHTPNVATFTRLVDVYCNEKGVEEARKTINALKQKGFFLDEKAITEHLGKKGSKSPMVREAIFGLKKSGPVSF